MRAVIEEVFEGFHWFIHTEDRRKIAVTGADNLRRLMHELNLEPWREMQTGRTDPPRVQRDVSREWFTD